MGKDENIILAAPLMNSHIDVISEKQPCEVFMAHSKEVSCKTGELNKLKQILSFC